MRDLAIAAAKGAKEDATSAKHERDVAITATSEVKIAVAETIAAEEERIRKVNEQKEAEERCKNKQETIWEDATNAALLDLFNFGTSSSSPGERAGNGKSVDD